MQAIEKKLLGNDVGHLVSAIIYAETTSTRRYRFATSGGTSNNVAAGLHELNKELQDFAYSV